MMIYTQILYYLPLLNSFSGAQKFTSSTMYKVITKSITSTGRYIMVMRICA